MRRLAAMGLAVLLTACGAASSSAGDPEQVTVFAASSLTDAFTDLGDRFEAANPGVDVVLNLAGSSTLARQLVQGAPADVFASADVTQMEAVRDEGLLDGAPEVVATNRLAIAVEAGNPRDVEGLADLDRPDLTVVLAAEEVPAGRYAREALDAAGVTVEPASLETDVRAVLSRVALGEADAGIVYASDLEEAGDDVGAVALPEARDVVARYPVGVLDGASPSGRAFVRLLVSEEGREVMAAHGFGAP